MKDSLNGAIKDRINSLVKELAKHILGIIEEKPINYGVQLIISGLEGSSEEKIPLNIYYSAKKGVSTVLGGSDNSPLKKTIATILDKRVVEPNNKTTITKPFHNWDNWIGTDEAGKGEFYGALVVAGFYVDKQSVAQLNKLKVKDSKLTKQKEVYEIAHQLYKLFPEHIEVISLDPKAYNKLYSEFAAKGKKLNELLAWAHGRVILNLTKKWGKQPILIDKFTQEGKLLSALKELKELEIIQKTKAESDLAVAAASIIARYHYLQSLERLTRRYRLTIPSGSGKKSIDFGRQFIKEHSVEELSDIAKVHFKNYEQIIHTINT
ncbi:MAG: ribonuclease HIII [Candidatus Cloacimonas sp.]|nr:ribonuclease HIII [Candidatus Cloacimonadota bacterium]